MCLSVYLSICLSVCLSVCDILGVVDGGGVEGVGVAVVRWAMLVAAGAGAGQEIAQLLPVSGLGVLAWGYLLAQLCQGEVLTGRMAQDQTLITLSEPIRFAVWVL